MKLYYYQDKIGNFGDDLNPWLWSRLIPGLLDDDAACLFVGIGTLLNHRLPSSLRKVVFGAGVGYGRVPRVDERWAVYCVRGPLSAHALGLPAELAITDPAMLISTLAPKKAVKRFPVSFMPHHISEVRANTEGASLQEVCEGAGLHYIPPGDSVEQVLDSIQASDLVVTEAMHGAIVADALRIQWIPVRLYSHVLQFKWCDWCGSLGLEYESLLHAPSEPTAASRLEQFLRRVGREGRPSLSDETRARIAVSRLQEKLAQLKEGIGTAWTPSQVWTALRREAQGGTGAGEAWGRDLPPQPDPAGADDFVWLHQIRQAREQLSHLIPTEARYILIDGDEWRSAPSFADRRSIPFLERDGQYWGPPADDQTAIQELERLLESGAGYAVFASPAYWWLDQYPGLHEYLRTRFHCQHHDERVIVFGLRS